MFWCILLFTALISGATGLNVRLWPLNERRTEGFVEVYNEGEWGFLGSINYRFNDLSASYLCQLLQISEFGYGGVWTPVGTYKGFSWLSYIDCKTNGTCFHPTYAKGPVFDADSQSYNLSYGNSLHCVDSKLINGKTHNVGILQTSIAGRIYTVCFDGFDMNAAEVVCNNLGFHGAVSITAVDSEETQIYYNAFMCDGSEYSLLECNHSTDDLLNCQKIVQITCKAVRLMSTNEYNDEGAVEMFYNGTWGFVGNPGNAVSDQTARYLCDRFGFGQSGFGAMAHELKDYDRIGRYQKLECLGNETHIMQCDHGRAFTTPPLKYTYFRGSWLYCFDFNITHVRLVNGSSYKDGRVLLEINGRWGSICTVEILLSEYKHAGNILCQTMGFRSVESVYEVTGKNTDLVWMNQVLCSGSETAISECPHLKGAHYTCYDIPTYLGVTCNDYDDCESNPCLNGGSCFDAFKNYTCECMRPWGGINCDNDLDCENVIDGCSEDPCSLGRNCTSLEAFEQRDKNRTYTCDARPSGFESNDEYNDTCSDFNECVNEPCSHNCTNTVGSYECTCIQGYRTDTRDKDRCTDINECEDLNTPHDCEQNCTNTEGSYNCSCFEGYSLNMSGNCTPNLTLEHLCSIITCSQSRGGCTMNAEGNPVCFCNSGYELAINDSCIDINECSRNACPQNCNNTIGGFECGCFTGYTLKGLATCQECDTGFWGENCQNECKCTGKGWKSCDHVKGCICKDGWQGDTCENINECNTTIDICNDPRKKCDDLEGSYHCKCMEGFIETGNGKCEDIDECSIPSLNTCDQICKNNVGSYSCECKSGFKAENSSCENIDECALKVHDCEQICDDKTGSYNCFCYYGYTLNDDRRTCTKFFDPCMTLHGFNCSHYCFINTSHFECRCQDGFNLGSDSQTCIEMDECKNGLHLCDAEAECKNTDGSYTCKCPIGSKLENDGRTCTECDRFHYGENCASNCSCLHGDCDRTSGCKCENGWRGNNCDIDLDECATEQVMCSKPNEVCVNTLGSAVCHCINGYHRNDSDVCVDVNECSNGRLNTCDQLCVNLPGGYTCECESGFLIIDGKCQDINECENQKSDCEQLCENTLGSYRCYCEDGFKLNQTERVSCRPSSECSNNTCGVHAICFNYNGVESCLCMNGFHNVSGTCEDVDECETSPKLCSHKCANTNGSYNCTCHSGYYLAKDYQTCRECESGTYGVDCKQNCSCDVHNSESCDHITGVCWCKPGWNGTRCTHDINECYNQTLCPNHSTCVNTIGGYACNCDVGHFETSFGICAVCDDTHYGENCAKECTCMQSGTVLCNNTNGYCECIAGWKGKTCSIDEDECAKVPAICEVKDNSACKNTPGSYKCMCDEGFRDIGDTCVDIDECLTGVHNCTQECVNTNGSYICKYCGRLSVSNGQVDVSNGTTPGSIAIITCNQGYNLNGSAVVVCLAAGWNDTSMECVLQDCGALGSPENGHTVSNSGTVFNSTVTFSCNAGFLLVGESTLLCRNDGQWSSNVPTCVRLGSIGEPCETSDYCKAEGAICKMSLCSCQTGVYDTRTDKCDTMPLYPYGESEGDLVVESWNECARRVKFSLGIPLFGKTHIRLFVCPHGVVTFGRRYNNPTPPKNNNEVNGLPRDMLAPFHAQFKSSSGSSSSKVYYRSYDVLDSYAPLKDRAEIRDIEDHVRQFGVISSFEASFVLIATWENVLLDTIDLTTENAEASTFQLVLVSNGEMTYSYYIYPDGLMKWINNRRSYAPVWVGYFGKKHTAFTHPYSFTPNVLALDKKTKHGGVSGVVFNSLVHVENSTNNNNVSCVTWYQENKQEKQHIDLMYSRLPQCPCDISLARWDPWFWHIDRRHWLNTKNFTCVDMLPDRMYWPYGKSCCYDYRTSLWVDERPIAGGFFRYHPENKADHYKHDVVPKEMCCSPLTSFCKFYYDLRPTGTCYRESPYNFGSFWGDPHFRTLDGLNFTFNGLGEYTLLQIQTENNTFYLQARTERTIKADGNISDATVFSAFAAKDETNASVHVELNKAKMGFNIYGNGLDLTKQYTQKTDDDTPLLEVPGKTLLVSKRGETLVVLFPSSGISLNISVSVEMLSLSTIVPKKLHNVTSGLLGNYNENPEDDFTLPNGTILGANITEREIFSYGRNWAIDADNAAFTYPEGKNHSDYHNETYVPRFLDEVDLNKRLEAEKACNGSDNIECVFDYVFTEKEEIALATNLLKGIADKTRKEMDEVIPSLIGCESVNISVNHTVTCPVIIDDGTSVDFLANNVNATFNQITKSFSYFQANDQPVDIRVIARNSNGRSSPAFIFAMLLCTGCNGRGYCTNIAREDERDTEHFKYATCECQPEYEGPDCENVFDGCSEDPCSLGRNCTSLDAFDQRDKNRTYMCDACPSGFVSNDEYNDICSDFDECVNKPCSHNCANTDGSYECTCNQGYRTDTRDRDRCTDINECEDLNTPHDCEQNCTNTEGSYSCSCFEGYSLNMSGNCTPNLTLEDLCSNITCSQSRGGCTMNDEGNPVCFCNSGYELAINDSCIDIDECRRNACPQNCNNTIGGFECSCFTGYKLKGLATCRECDSGFWGENCQNECKCTGEGFKSCDPVKGCICKDGWQGDTCDENINECNTTIDICNDPRKKCDDLQGSYHCKCMEGFIETGNGKCEDIDECSIPSINTCDQFCKNTVGSYSCECKSGFKAENSSCENIDECALKVHDCEQVCDDKTGAYNCFCYYGYTLNDDRRTCTKVSDPCMTLHGFNCSHYCFISTGYSECRCQDGFNLGSDNQTCIDIDECKNGPHLCDAEAECKNTDGSYTCTCPIGSKLENDGRTCTECDRFHYGENCASNCNCLHGDCDRTSGCKCENGWRGNNCDIDLDECATEQVMCSKPNEVCVNTLGSAVCHCINAYHRNDSDVCVDVNECSNGRLNTCDQSCVNLPGGYTCECESGFLFIGGKCQDINECENQKSDCEQLCENTLGSYRCYCEDGFKLNQTDRVSCRPASECSNNACGVYAICFNYNGVEGCLCMNGFNNDSGTCEDVDECKISPKPCSHNCTNTNGSYNCACHGGYYLAKDYQTCRECESGTYGVDCKQNCSCDVHNSESCDHINGECKCMSGWNGTNCTNDINECYNETVCPYHSTCNNADGGYDCNCDVGYFKTSSGICAVCDDTHYGDNCAEECTCMQSGTVSCNNTDGYCECNKGWKGKNCSEDKNECSIVPDICADKDNSSCINTQGSYKCKCDEGFKEIGETCVDVDECNTGIHKCAHDCVNIHGSYTCKCKKGYQGYWNSCKECSDHTYGENCTNTCRCRHTNTIPVESGEQICDRVTGKCQCKVNWEGEFCDEDVNECNDASICNTKPILDNLPKIIGISVGCGLLVLIIGIPVIVCIRRRTNCKKQTKKRSTDGLSLPDVPSQKQGLEYVTKWQDNQSGSNDPKYQTWRTILTQPASKKLDENVYDEPFKIPRARARQPTKPSTDNYLYF